MRRTHEPIISKYDRRLGRFASLTTRSWRRKGPGFDPLAGDSSSGIDHCEAGALQHMVCITRRPLAYLCIDRRWLVFGTSAHRLRICTSNGAKLTRIECKGPTPEPPAASWTDTDPAGFSCTTPGV